MPVYHPLGTEIALHTWDPKDPASEGQTIPSLCPTLQPLTEEYFESQKGIDFIGEYSTPFFVINAGNDLFYRKRITKPTVSKAASKALEDYTRPLPVVGRFSKRGKDYDTAALSLSSLPSSSQGEVGENLGSSSSIEAEGTPTKTNKISLVWAKDKVSRGWSVVNSKIQLDQTRDILTKPIVKPIPIKIQLGMSVSTFMKSLNDNEPEDICVNIFFNGEFTHSNIYRANTLRRSTADEKRPSFSGRRVASTLEVPWVILPQSQVSKEQTSAEVWHTVNALLSNEANEWGMETNSTEIRTPMGAYLASLSELEIPNDIKGGGIGIIDVIVVLGRSVPKSEIKSLTLQRTRRNLPQAICGLAKKMVTVPVPMRNWKTLFTNTIREKDAVVAEEPKGVGLRDLETPKNIPQKAYRGQPPSAARKEAIISTKNEDLMEYTPVSPSTRSKRSSCLVDLNDTNNAPGPDNSTTEPPKKIRRMSSVSGTSINTLSLAKDVVSGTIHKSTPIATIEKKQRRPARDISARELKGLLPPHTPSMGLHTSFGESFIEASTTRQVRKMSSSSKEKDVRMEVSREDTSDDSSKEITGLKTNNSDGNIRKMPGLGGNPSEVAVKEVSAKIVEGKILAIQGVSIKTLKVVDTESEVATQSAPFPQDETSQKRGKVSARKPVATRRDEDMELEKQRKLKASSSLGTNLNGPFVTPILKRITSARHPKPEERLEEENANKALVKVTMVAIKAHVEENGPRKGSKDSPGMAALAILPKTLAAKDSSKSKLKPKPTSVMQSPPILSPTKNGYNSVLAYADEFNTEGWLGLKQDHSSGEALRTCRQEREGVFRGSSILMGVRYVFGADCNE